MDHVVIALQLVSIELHGLISLDKVILSRLWFGIEFYEFYTFQSGLWSLLRNGSLESPITLKAQDLD